MTRRNISFAILHDNKYSDEISENIIQQGHHRILLINEKGLLKLLKPDYNSLLKDMLLTEISK